MALPDQCPLCGADAAEQNVLSRHVYGAPPHISCFRCGTCEVTYLHPVLTPEEKAQFYAEEFPAFMAGRAPDKGGWDESDEHVRANEPQRQRRMRYLERLLPAPGGRILDVGCASGFMLYPLAERGFHCAGVEPAERFADYVRGAGPAVFRELGRPPRRPDWRGWLRPYHAFLRPRPRCRAGRLPARAGRGASPRRAFGRGNQLHR